MWVLVLVNMMYNTGSQDIEPSIEAWWEVGSMIQCFQARSSLGNALTGAPGYFPAGTQAICLEKKQ